MDSIDLRFEQFKKHDHYSLIDPKSDVDLFMGLDEKGRKVIELRAVFKPERVLSTDLIEVTQFNNDSYNSIRFSLKEDDFKKLFYKFCDDLIEQVIDYKKKSSAYKIIIERFYQWRKLFYIKKGTFLTEPQIMGLIGEILFMNIVLSKKLDWSNVLNSWSGQELTHKDFSYKDSWYEVKAISTHSDTVRISSLEQLDSLNDGELVVVVLEKMSPEYHGIKLNDIIISTMKKFDKDEEKDLFLSKVSLQGYFYNEYYDNYVYELKSIHRYIVDKSFPKITKNDVSKGIVKATYDISLVDIQRYKLDKE